MGAAGFSSATETTRCIAARISILCAGDSIHWLESKDSSRCRHADIPFYVRRVVSRLMAKRKASITGAQALMTGGRISTSPNRAKATTNIE